MFVTALQEGRVEVNGNGWKPISMGSEDITHTVLSNSRYIGNGRNNRLIYHNYNYETILPTLNLSPTIKLNYSASGKARTIDDHLHNYQIDNQWIGKTYPQRRNDNSEKIVDYISREISHSRKNVISKVSSKVIPIPISSHVSQDNFSIRPRNHGQRKINEPEQTAVNEGRKISSRNRNYVKIIPYSHVPNRSNVKEKVKNSNKSPRNTTKIIKDKVNVVKANLNSQIKTESVNKIEQNARPVYVRPPNLLTKEYFMQNFLKNVVTPRPNSKVASNLPLKKWPSEVVPNMQDLYNADKYFSSQEIKTKSNQQQSLISGHLDNNQQPPIHASMEEMIQWLRIPAFSTNQSHMIKEESGKPISNTFEPIYEDLEPNTPLRPIDDSSIEDKIDPIEFTKDQFSEQLPNDQYFKPQYYFSSPQLDSMINSLQDPSLTRQPVYKPTSQVVQDTVVHIMNPGSKKPNVTITGSKKPPSKLSTTNHTSGSPPNVHIMFMSDDMANPSNNSDSLPVVKDDCPTILINSITKVKNKIESKEGCTDLNIVINSHILNTNVFTSPASSSIATEAQKQPVTDQFANDQFQTSPTNGPFYQSEPTTNFDPFTQNYYSSQVDAHQQLKIKTPQVTTVPENSVEIISGTKINIGSGEVSGPTYDVFSDDSEEPDGPPKDGGPIEAEAVEAPVEAVELPAESEAATAAEAVNDAATSIATTTVEASDNATSFNETGLSSSGVGTGAGQANDGASGVTLNRPKPSIPNLSGVMNLAGSEAIGQLSDSNVLGSAPGPGGGGGAAAAIDDYDEDDDDDYFDYDDFDLSPSGMMNSMTSMFSSFSYLNPLNYSLMSVSIAPFAAFAAGVLGVAAFLFPWAFPGTLDFARSSDRVDVRFTPGLEEIVKQAIRKYRNWNEWKSKRRKRRRRR